MSYQDYTNACNARYAKDRAKRDAEDAYWENVQRQKDNSERLRNIEQMLFQQAVDKEVARLLKEKADKEKADKQKLQW